MNENLVTSLYISQQMKEAGIEQKLDEGDWAYCSCCNKLHLFANDDDDNIYCIDHKIENVEEWHKAFTAGELGEMLWQTFEKIGWSFLYKAYGEVFNFPGTQYIGELGIINLMRKPDMAAKMLLHLKKEGLIGKEGG
jgi:hypothetical protein